MNIALWIVQGLLAALFLFAGAMKLIMPIEEILKQLPVALPGWFVQLTGVIELLGAVGLILPWLLRKQSRLTPLAAVGLMIVMIGATAYNLVAGDVTSALVTVVIALLCAFVAYGRWKITPPQR